MDNLSKINIIKRKNVQEAVKIAKATSIIKRMIIFGSSVTNDCRDESDVDICLDVTCDVTDKRLFRPMYDIDKACDFNCDILLYHDIGTKLKQIIDRKGVEVYAVR